MSDTTKTHEELLSELNDMRQQLHTNNTQKPIKPLSKDGIFNIYQILVENLPDTALLIFDSELRYIIAGGTALRAYGFSKEMVEGRTLREVLSPEMCEIFEPCYRAALQGADSSFNLERERRSYLVQIRPLKNEQGDIVAGLAIYQDITEQQAVEAELKHYRDHLDEIATERAAEWVTVNEKLLQQIVEREWAEEALQKIKQRYELAIKAGKVGVWDWDLWTHEIYMDPFLQTSLGFPEDSIHNLDDWMSHVHPEDEERVRSTVQAHFEGGTSNFELEHRMLHQDGSIRWFLVRGSTVRDSNNNPYRLIGTNTDITEYKQAEEALKEAHQELSRKASDLETANTELAQYAYVVSHDLKAPLRAIHNYAEFLFEDLQNTLNEDQNEYLDGLMEAVSESEALVDDLLELSRIGRRSVAPERVDLHIFLKDMIASFDLPTDCKISLPEDWPVIETQPPLLRQIFQNLIQNGFKFNQAKNKRIEMGWQPVENEAYEIFVRDNGIGIPKKYQDRIFQVFQRLHTQDEYPGTGIGLAIVKKATETLQGTVQMESEANKGSTFYITLPKIQIVD